MINETVPPGCDECFYVSISSKACRYCGRRGILSRKAIEQHLLDYTWMNYAVEQAMYYMNPNQGEHPDPVLAHLWLRTTLRKDHPSYIDPVTLGYGQKRESK